MRFNSKNNAGGGGYGNKPRGGGFGSGAATGGFRSNGGGFGGGPRVGNGKPADTFGRNLRAVDWQDHSLSDFKKDFYCPHPNVINRPYGEVQRYRESKEITLKGDEKHFNPIQFFEEGNFPDYINNSIKHFGFDFPTAIQAQGWPIALSGKNMVVGIAMTGSGKTLAYIVPAVIHIILFTMFTSIQ